MEVAWFLPSGILRSTTASSEVLACAWFPLGPSLMVFYGMLRVSRFELFRMQNREDWIVRERGTAVEIEEIQGRFSAFGPKG